MLQRERKLVLYIQLGSDSDGHVHRGPLCDFYALCRELLLHELNLFFFFFFISVQTRFPLSANSNSKLSLPFTE